MKAMMILLLAVTTAFPVAWHTLTPSGDSYVAFWDDNGGEEYDEYDDDNFGSENLLKLMYHESQVGYSYYYPYINFNLSSYAGDTLLAAELRIYVEGVPDGDQTLWLVNSTWEEMTITYNNRPAATWLLDMAHLPTGWNTISLPIADMQPFITNPAQFFGFTMLDTHQAYPPILGKFHSRENTHPPELRLYISGAVVEEATWGQLKARL